MASAFRFCSAGYGTKAKLHRDHAYRDVLRLFLITELFITGTEYGDRLQAKRLIIQLYVEFITEGLDYCGVLADRS